MEEVVHTRFPHQILIQVNAGVSYTYERAKAADQEMLAALNDQVEEKLKAEQVNVTYETISAIISCWDRWMKTG
mgnify:CR=1 FL=1